MVESTTNIRVRYGETDQMGHLYYGFYAWYYEVGRVEMLRELGIVYKEIEKSGTLMVVAQLNAKYLKPAKYDELIRVKTRIPILPRRSMLVFEADLINQKGELINKGEVKLICVDASTRQRTEIPLQILNILKPYFE